MSNLILDSLVRLWNYDFYDGSIIYLRGKPKIKDFEAYKNAVERFEKQVRVSLIDYNYTIESVDDFYCALKLFGKE